MKVKFVRIGNEIINLDHVRHVEFIPAPRPDDPHECDMVRAWYDPLDNARLIEFYDIDAYRFLVALGVRKAPEVRVEDCPECGGAGRKDIGQSWDQQPRCPRCRGRRTIIVTADGAEVLP